MTTIQLEGNDIQKFLDMAINQFNLKVKVIEDVKFPTLAQKKKSRWDKIDNELRSLKTVDINAGEELREALTLLGDGVKVGDCKTSRDRYLTTKYGL